MNTIEQDLKALGDIPEQVANSLRALGIKGRRGDEYNCPIARCLRKKGYNVECVGSRNTFSPVVDKPIKNPNAIFIFINSFDRGQYPDLEDI
jgi:hypothetical protein